MRRKLLRGARTPRALGNSANDVERQVGAAHERQDAGQQQSGLVGIPLLLRALAARQRRFEKAARGGKSAQADQYLAGLSSCYRRGLSSKSNGGAKMFASLGQSCACRRAPCVIVRRMYLRQRCWYSATQAFETVCSWAHRFALTCGPPSSMRPSNRSPRLRARPHARSQPHGRPCRTTVSCIPPARSRWLGRVSGFRPGWETEVLGMR